MVGGPQSLANTVICLRSASKVTVVACGHFTIIHPPVQAQTRTKMGEATLRPL